MKYLNEKYKDYLKFRYKKGWEWKRVKWIADWIVIDRGRGDWSDTSVSLKEI